MEVCERFDRLGFDEPGRTFQLGIFGGTFDPVHTGHLAAAEHVRDAAGLDAVIFMPAGVPVFKLDKKVTAGEDRLAMCRLATAANPYFDVSDMEVRRAGNTYTYETLRELRAHYPDNVEFHFIAGADAIISLGKWRNARELTQLAHSPSTWAIRGSTWISSRCRDSTYRRATCGNGLPQGTPSAMWCPMPCAPTSRSTGCTDRRSSVRQARAVRL